MSSFNSVVKFASIPTKIAHKPRKNFHSPVNFNNNNRKARIFIINFIYDFPRSPERTKRREKFPLKCSWHSLAKYTVERIFLWREKNSIVWTRGIVPITEIQKHVFGNTILTSFLNMKFINVLSLNYFSPLTHIWCTHDVLLVCVI